MPTDSRFVFRIPTPSTFTQPERQVERLTQDLNRILNEIGIAFRSQSGLSGVAVPFEADLNLKGHRVTEMGQPIALQDSATKRYVDELIAELRKITDQILGLMHDEPTPSVSGQRSIYLTRALPTVVGDTVDIGSFKLVHSGHNLDIAVTVGDPSFSVAKRWLLATNFSINSDWQIALPIIDTGAFSGQNFALDVKQEDANLLVRLRLRRTAGATAGTAVVHIEQRGKVDDSFTESSATASVTAPTVILENALLSEVDGSVLINTPVPGHLVAGWTNVTVSGGTAAGVFEVITQAADADVVQLGHFLGTDKNSVNADKRAGIVEIVLDGTTANNRGGRIRFWTKPDAGSSVLREVLDRLGNHGFNGAVAFGATAAGTLAQKNGTAPTADVVDQYAQYAADQVAGNAAPHFRTENGSVVKLYKEAALTAVNAGALSTGGAAVLSAADQGIIDNMRTRINNLEARLQAHGLLT